MKEATMTRWPLTSTGSLTQKPAGWGAHDDIGLRTPIKSREVTRQSETSDRPYQFRNRPSSSRNRDQAGSSSSIR